jgi:hypothetical protein
MFRTVDYSTKHRLLRLNEYLISVCKWNKRTVDFPIRVAHASLKRSLALFSTIGRSRKALPTERKSETERILCHRRHARSRRSHFTVNALQRKYNAEPGYDDDSFDYTKCMTFPVCISTGRGQFQIRNCVLL